MNRDKRFLQTALAVAEIWSKDPSTKVGAIAVGARPNQVAFGYNGFPPGVDDSPFTLADREEKLKLTLHAEVNALANAPFDVETLYVTHHPCDHCALHILASRTVKRVVFRVDARFEGRWKDSLVKAQLLLTNAGVQVQGIEL